MSLFLLFSSKFVPSSFAQALPDSSALQVRVRLSVAQSELRLQGLGFQILGKSQGIERVALPRLQSLVVKREKLNGNLIWKVWREQHLEIFPDKFLALRGIEIRQDGKTIPNQIFLAGADKPEAAGSPAFDVIGILPLENYLVGVLAGEMPLSWPMETLKAQAIAARSYALATIQERAQQIYHLESSILDQVYNHVSLQFPEKRGITRAREAVIQTAGQILVDSQGKVLKAFYHSDCGGRTASPRNVWGAGAKSGVVTEDYCLTNPKADHNSWSLVVGEEELRSRLQSFLKKPSLPVIRDLSLIRSGPKDRVSKVEISFAGEEKIQILAHELRAALGYDRLRSTLFSVSRSEEQFYIVGQGFGHGVGLCQWGSRVMGMQGRRYLEILAHYYPGARIHGTQQLLAQAVLRNSQKLELQTKSR